MAATASAVAADEGPIKIGEYGAFSGKEAAFGIAARKGAILAFEEANATGGVLGRKVELLTEDNQSKAGESATIAKKFVSRDKVIAVLGGNPSSNSLEAAPILQNAKIPMIAISSTNPRVTETGNYIFRVCFIDPFQGAVLAKFAKDTLHAKRAAIITSVNNAYSVGISKVFREKFTAAGGEVVIEQKHSEGDKDFRAQLTAIKAAGVDCIFHSSNYTEGALICIQARQFGFTGPIFGGDAWEAPQLIEIGGAAVEGTYYSTHASPESTAPVMQNFIRKFRARWDGETPDSIAALGYDAAALLFDALKRAGTTDSAKLREAIATTRDFSGVTGHITIDPDRNATKSAVILTVKNGKFAYVETVDP
ncbi:ABC transporter substrate-binding protein [Opitutus sp. GAS368]|uniref:ABC transporter substrate-binding protein n=1 Tax=Opitutus sp. GAS368 TaxID=1882749 RepID=UPI001E4D6407|nr:ABC transporter substrate-binding protein [Opitutus sp. GAS368]